MLVKKPSTKCWMCVGFTDLNKPCPKGNFLLPHINLAVDSMVGHRMSRRRHSSPTGGLYCYSAMPFELKIVGATYQRLVNRMFKDQIERNMKVYVDDLLVKSETPLDNLQEAFAVL